MLRTPIAVIITHIAGWLLFLSLPLVFITNNGNVGITEVLLAPAYWLCFICFALLFYLHTYVLIPVLYNKMSRWFYFFSIALLVVFILWIRPFDRLFNVWSHQQAVQQEEQMPPDRFAPRKPPPDNAPFAQRHQPPPALPPRNENKPGQLGTMQLDIVSLFMLLVCLAVGFTLDTHRRLRTAAEQAAKAEADKANAELSFLKAQINPHFLFNTLNNLYSLALTNSNATADAILKLSNIMRYVTDEVHEDFVPLQSEVDCITDFIDLQRLRAGSKLIIDYSVKGDLIAKRLPPLILTTFVENIFKYGISNHQPCTVVISIKAMPDFIKLFCSNQVFEQKNSARKGTGIANAKKRLDHLYANKYSLIIDNTNEVYSVNLVLQD